MKKKLLFLSLCLLGKLNFSMECSGDWSKHAPDLTKIAEQAERKAIAQTAGAACAATAVVLGKKLWQEGDAYSRAQVIGAASFVVITAIQDTRQAPQTEVVTRK